jgi:hypothetical protein
VCIATYHLSRAEWQCLQNFEARKDNHIDDNRNICAYYGASVANSSALRQLIFDANSGATIK